jgi:hypothetical protein
LLFVIGLACGQNAMAQECTESAYYRSTLWKSHNLDTNFISYYFLEEDGTVGISKVPTRSKSDEAHTWEVEYGYLVLVFSDGYATERYPIDGQSCDAFLGQKTSEQWSGEKDVRLTRMELK